MFQENKSQILRFALVTAGLVVLLFFLCPPDSLVYTWFWKPVIRRGTYIAIAICFALYFWKVRIDIFGALAIAYWLVMMLSTWLMDASLWVCARTYLPMVASMLLVRSLFSAHKKQLLWAALILSAGYLVVNFAGTLFLPEGTKIFHLNASSGLLGNRNSFPRFFLMALCSSALLDVLSDRKFGPKTIAIFLLCVAQTSLSPSSTGAVALLFVALALIAVGKKAVRKYLNVGTYAAGYLAIFLSFVVFRVQGLVEPLLVGVLNRDSTLSGRTEIWDAIFGMMKDPLRLLVGYCGNPEPILVFYSPIKTGHNAIMDILYNGGLLGLAIALLFCLFVGRFMFRRRNNWSVAVVAVFLGAFLILGITEHIVCVPFCFIVSCGFCAAVDACDSPRFESGRSRRFFAHQIREEC